MSKKTYIYGLMCPLEDKFFYVGKTTNLEKRFKEHLTDGNWVGKHLIEPGEHVPPPRDPRIRWLDRLHRKGQEPVLVTLTTTDEKALVAERSWIEQLLMDGHPLTNCHGVNRSNRDSVFNMEVNVEALKEFRRRRVLTVEKLAKEAGVSKNTISRAENGGRIYPTSIHKIARALGVEPSELIR